MNFQTVQSTFRNFLSFCVAQEYFLLQILGGVWNPNSFNDHCFCLTGSVRILKTFRSDTAPKIK